MEFSYYPGCSLHSTAVEYDSSVRATFAELGVILCELEDWNCCGASSAHATNRLLSLSLPARNIAIAQRSGLDIVFPCAACYNRHKTADHEMREYSERRAAIESVVDFEFGGTLDVRPVLDVIGNLVGIEKLKSKVSRPLVGLKVVSYYGCLLVRPPDVTRFDNPEHPTLMDRILEAVGAEVQRWAYSTDCCGGGLALTKPDLAARMVRRLVERGREAGAVAIVTSCPLCQLNLEMRQDKRVAEMPIFYFTELIGAAMGLPQANSWWRKHLVDPAPVLAVVDAG
jgi:heterodisulfide reductase subunit B